MEKLKVKHNHSFTDILKVTIFACVIMAPLFAVLFECCYAAFNEGSSTAYTDPQNCLYNAVAQWNVQPLFNWTMGTAMYNVINNMLNTLEMGLNNPLATLLTYMIIITIIYVIFDIVIEIFKWLTHLIGEK